MKNIINKINLKIDQLLNDKVISNSIPPQGMDSNVVLTTMNSGKEYAVKYSNKGLEGDIQAFQLIKDNHIDVLVPKLITHFSVEDTTVLILEKINFPLLDSMQPKDMARYIPSMLENLIKIHTVKSEYCGLLATHPKEKDWKKILLSIFENTGYGIDWEIVLTKDGLDKNLVKNAVTNIVKKIKETNFENSAFSLIHTDFNQRNLFVDPDSDQITGIIDWSESMFGDPLLDFARVRMFIWHFKLEDQIIDDYYRVLNFSEAQKDLEELYLLIRIIEYLAYYSEDLNEFNTERIMLHQNFLRNYKWNIN